MILLGGADLLLVLTLVVSAGPVAQPPVVVAAPPVTVPCGDTPGLIAAIAAAAEGPTIVLEAGCTYELTGVDTTTLNGANGLPVITKTMTMRSRSTTSHAPITRSPAAWIPGRARLSTMEAAVPRRTRQVRRRSADARQARIRR